MEKKYKWCYMCATESPFEKITVQPGQAVCVIHYDLLESRRKSNYEKLGKEIGALVGKKQREYGDSFGRSGDVLRILYPNGISHRQYDDALAIVRILDKLFRIATRADSDEESPFRDIAGYGLLGTMKHEVK